MSAFEEAARAMLDSIYEALGDNAGSFTCGEADAIADAYRANGDHGLADNFLAMHAEGDDGGDSHEPVYAQSEFGDWQTLVGWKHREDEED